MSDFMFHAFTVCLFEVGFATAEVCGPFKLSRRELIFTWRELKLSRRELKLSRRELKTE